MRKKSARSALLLAAIAIMACGVAACGSSSSSTGSASAAPSSAGSSSAATSSAAPSATAAQEISDVGVSSSTSFCGTKKIVLGVHDGFGVNAWSQESLAAV